VSGDPPQLTRLDPADLDTVRAMHGVELAAQQVDDPQGPPWSARDFQARLTLGPPLAEPSEAWYVPDDSSACVNAWYCVRFPDRENLEWAILMLTVHPAARRHGLGTALLRHAAGRAAATGRTGIVSHIRHGSPGEAFAVSAGAEHGIDNIQRVLDLSTVPPGLYRELRDSAARAATGYSLATWTGPTPVEHLPGMAVMLNTMNDAPRDDGQDPEFWDADRIRLDEQRGTASGNRRYVVAAIHDASGEMAGYTELAVSPELPEWGYQGNTAVARPHRGHRLGLLVKAAMLTSIADAEPALRRIRTWNAASNAHMIAVNERLGFAVSGTPMCFAAVQVSRLLGVRAQS